MAQPFCPECGNETLTTFRDPPGTRCNTCGWQGDLWDGHRVAMESQEELIATLRDRLTEVGREGGEAVREPAPSEIPDRIWHHGYSHYYAHPPKDWPDAPEYVRADVVARAVAAERERCCRRVCEQCAEGDNPLPMSDGTYWHASGTNYAIKGMQPCAASAIRAADPTPPERLSSEIQRTFSDALGKTLNPTPEEK